MAHPKKIDKLQKKLELEANKEEGVEEIDKLVSLAFDEDPQIRLEVAKRLAQKLEDPRAVLALLELSSDKNKEVQTTAKNILENYNSPDKEAFVSLGKFFEELKEKQIDQEEIQKEKSLMLPQIEKLFTSNKAKEKLLPSIDKIFEKTLSKTKKEKSVLVAQTETIEKEIPKIEEHNIKDKLHADLQAKEKPAQMEELTTRSQNQKQEINEIASIPLPQEIKQKIDSPIFSIPKIEQPPEEIEEENQEQESIPVSFLEIYKRAYLLAITAGIKASDLNKEKKRLINETKKNIALAFKLALKKAQQEGGIESLSGLKVGMKKINTLPLEVIEVLEVNIEKNKKQIPYSKLIVSDGKTSLPFYLDKKKAEGIKKTDHIAIKGAYVDYLLKNPYAQKESEKGELCLFLSKKGQINIIRTNE